MRCLYCNGSDFYDTYCKQCNKYICSSCTYIDFKGGVCKECSSDKITSFYKRDINANSSIIHDIFFDVRCEIDIYFECKLLELKQQYDKYNQLSNESTETYFCDLRFEDDEYEANKAELNNAREQVLGQLNKFHSYYLKNKGDWTIVYNKQCSYMNFLNNSGGSSIFYIDLIK